MANYLSDSGGKDFEIHPEGRFAARCIRVIGLGTHTTEYMGQAKDQEKLLIAFETTELMPDGQFKGQPFVVTARFTASIHKKATLGKMLIKWRGRDFTAEEAKKFDIETIAGLDCMIDIEHNTNHEGKTFANIDGVRKLQPGMDKCKPFNKVLCFNPKDPDMEVFKQLSKRLQETIQKSPEWIANQRGEEYAKNESDSGSGPSLPDDDSDIPF